MSFLDDKRTLEMRRLLLELEGVRLRGEDLWASQRRRHRETSQNTDVLQRSLDAARSTNAGLMTTVMGEKERVDSLQQQFNELKQNLVKCRRKLQEIRNVKSFENDTLKLEVKSKERREKISKLNQRLQATLKTKKVNIDFTSSPTQCSRKPVTSKYRTPINAVAIRNRLTTQKLTWN